MSYFIEKDGRCVSFSLRQDVGTLWEFGGWMGGEFVCLS